MSQTRQPGHERKTIRIFWVDNKFLISFWFSCETDVPFIERISSPDRKWEHEADTLPGVQYFTITKITVNHLVIGLRKSNLVGLHHQQLINQVVEPLYHAWHWSHDKLKTLVEGPTNDAKYKMMLDLEEMTIFLRFHDADIDTRIRINKKNGYFLTYLANNNFDIGFATCNIFEQFNDLGMA